MTFSIREVRTPDLVLCMEHLCGVIKNCVNEGASIGYLTPFDLNDARAFWLFVQTTLESGARRLLVAEEGGHIIGTIQIGLDMPPNGRHRADIMKLMVDPAARKKGIGKALMLAAEAIAGEENRTLLVLDTAGDEAERLYKALGWTVTGKVPNYARSTSGLLEATTIMWKVLKN